MSKVEKKVSKKVEKKMEKKPEVVPSPLIMPEVGVENIKDATHAMFYMLRVIMAEFKDGFDWNDIPVAMKNLAMDEEFRRLMGMAMSGRDKITEEVKGMDKAEALVLGAVCFNEIMALVDSMKK